MAHRGAFLSALPHLRVDRPDGGICGRDRRHIPAALSAVRRAAVSCRADDGVGRDYHHPFLGRAATDVIAAAGNGIPRTATPGGTLDCGPATLLVVDTGTASAVGEPARRVSAGSGPDGHHPGGVAGGSVAGA